VDGFPFVPMLIAGAVIGLGFIGLLLWSTARLKSQT
jgi:prepilin signal peptidase PulO-like enzyme (type II secretory pathway)